mmetsp:Transcript_35937/g.56063  ORF Transcript_35937/g.56063 Transcript_35937/m.56063 type:complete len:321 (+) Transcript_35937:155-1117(+)
MRQQWLEPKVPEIRPDEDWLVNPLNHSIFKTHQWSWNETELPDWYDINWGNLSEYKHKLMDLWGKNLETQQWEKRGSFMGRSNVSLSNTSRMLGPDEIRPLWLPPGNATVPEYHMSKERFIKLLEGFQRWKHGELPMELNEEDLEELKAEEFAQMNQQLCEACESGALGMVEHLLDAGANASFKESEDGMRPLHFACLNGHTEIAKILLEKNVPVNATDDWNRTALHWAAYNGHTEAAQLLYDAGIDVMAKTGGGNTAYAMASMFMHDHNDIINFFRKEEIKYNPRLGNVQMLNTTRSKTKERDLLKKQREMHPLASAYD